MDELAVPGAAAEGGGCCRPPALPGAGQRQGQLGTRCHLLVVQRGSLLPRAGRAAQPSPSTAHVTQRRGSGTAGTDGCWTWPVRLNV